MSQDQVGEARANTAWIGRLALGFIMAGVLANSLFNVGAVLLGYGHPYSTFLPWPEDMFGDFFKMAFSYPGAPVHPTPHWVGVDELFARFRDQVRQFEGTVINHFQMPPFPTLIALALRAAMTAIDPVILFIVAIGTALAAWFRTVQSRSNWRLGVAALLSYPTLMAIDRGHLFSLIGASCLVAASLRSFEHGRSRLLSMLLFAVALNFRPNAAIIPFALWVVRKYAFRDMCNLALLTIGLFLLSLAIAHSLYPDYTLTTFRSGLADYQRFYLVGNAGRAYGSSLYGALRALLPHSSAVFTIPVEVMLVLLGLAVLAMWRGLIGAAAFMFILVSAYALGSQVFADYHLMIYFVPLLLLAREERPSPHRAIMLGASIFVLIPKNYAFFADDGPFLWSIQVIMNPLVLLVTSAVVLIHAFMRPRGLNRPEWSRQPRLPESRQPLADGVSAILSITICCYC